MADRLRLALFLTILLLILQVAEGKNRPLREVPASEILAKIEKGQPVEYDHVWVVGDLSIDDLKGLPTRHIDRTADEIGSGASKDIKIVTSPIKISNSISDGIVSFDNTVRELIWEPAILAVLLMSIPYSPVRAACKMSKKSEMQEHRSYGLKSNNDFQRRSMSFKARPSSSI